MSLLHQDSPDQLDDAARGESFTHGTSHLVIASIAAVVLVSLAIAAYVITGEKPAAATGQVLEVWVHPMHSESAAFDASGVRVPQESFDQVLVFARIRLHNQSANPLFLHQIIANARFDDGIHSSYAAPASDYNRIFLAYPELAAWKATPLSTEATLTPGQTTEGTFVSAFHMTKARWDAHKGLDFSLAFRYQPLLDLKADIPVTVR
ncbi:MAG TPA: hypothetical protein VMV57_02830 [Terracidiphilus sp.]|nr:hypothetical protein [Terracidiphilus sp.]